MVSAYRFVTRPPDVEHGHPFLVYDSSGQLHFELTCFAKEATFQVTQKTTQVYLYALLPFFTWLDTQSHQLSSHRCWDELPEKVRSVVEDYLNQQMRCQLQQHHLGFQLVRATAHTPTRVRKTGAERVTNCSSISDATKNRNECQKLSGQLLAILGKIT